MYQEEYRNNLLIQKRKCMNYLMILNIFDGRYLWGLCDTISQFYESAVIVDEEERFLLSDQYISTVALS